MALNDARATIDALRKGEKPFEGLADHERLALLDEMLGGDDGQAVPANPLPMLRQLDSAALVTFAGIAADEIARRLGSVEPSAAERARIEEEAQHDPHPDGIIDMHDYARRVCGF